MINPLKTRSVSNGHPKNKPHKNTPCFCGGPIRTWYFTLVLILDAVAILLHFPLSHKSKRKTALAVFLLFNYPACGGTPFDILEG